MELGPVGKSHNYTFYSITESPLRLLKSKNKAKFEAHPFGPSLQHALDPSLQTTQDCTPNCTAAGSGWRVSPQVAGGPLTALAASWEPEGGGA